MQALSYHKERLLSIDELNFESQALELFRFQAAACPVYGEYISYLSVKPEHVTRLNEIPFLPIDLFKKHAVKSGEWQAQKAFLSSGTSSANRSCHYIEDEDFYHANAQSIFESHYGKLSDTKILALLPSYQEQGNSGLISMVDFFIKMTQSDLSGFYLYDYPKLEKALHRALEASEDVILFAVPYALLEFARETKSKFPRLTVIETGGMKGRGPDYTKMEMYEILTAALGVEDIHSEYGMTELISQAYAKEAGRLVLPNTMQVLIRDVNDPFQILAQHKTGGVNVIDLANAHSCAFIETMDIGKKQSDKGFEILGRMDNADLRGCSLLVS